MKKLRELYPKLYAATDHLNWTSVSPQKDGTYWNRTSDNAPAIGRVYYDQEWRIKFLDCDQPISLYDNSDAEWAEDDGVYKSFQLKELNKQIADLEIQRQNLINEN